MLPVLLAALVTSARFEHARGPGAEQCPDAAAFASRVEERLGRSPFDADAAAKLAVRIDAEGEAFRATIELSGDEPRVLEGSECAAVTERAVDEVARLFSPPPPVATRDFAPAPPTLMVESPPEPKPASSIGARLGAGVLAGAGFAPTANAGAYVFGGIGFGPWSLDLEGRFDFPATEETRDFTVQTALRMAQVVFCTRKGPAFGCALAGGGVVEARGENPNDVREGTFFHGHFGLRAGIESPIAGPLALRVAFDVLVPITRTTIEVRGNEAWITPPFGFAFGAGPSLRF